MTNAPHLFKDLQLTSNRGQVDGKGKGLEIQGEWTFKFSIKDDNGKLHTIKIPNSLYLSDLRVCLLLPQHWAQESGDRQTWMENYAHKCVFNWKGEENSSFQCDHQPTDFLHSSFFLHSSRSHHLDL
jgi:hypothetical protein